MLGQSLNAFSELSVSSNQLRSVERYENCRKRTRVAQEQGNSTLQGLRKKAISQRDISVGKSDILTYLVRGWRQANGVLWQINQTIKVTEACLNFQGERVVSSVKLAMMNAGMTATLTLESEHSFNVYATSDDSKAKAVNFDDVKEGSGKIGGTSWLVKELRFRVKTVRHCRRLFSLRSPKTDTQIAQNESRLCFSIPRFLV